MGMPMASGLTPGALVDDRYVIGAVLGEGGFATVYEARQLNIDREVALKVLHLESAGQGRERFVREAQAAARIEHPGSVVIHDFGFIGGDGPPYIVMERLRGHDLAVELDARGALGAARALRLTREALVVLAEAHRQGIVHKDLKPSNLFLVHPGTPREMLKVVDFGVAHVLESKRLTQAGQIPGTPQYMAPEYIFSQAATPALDVYQMGLLLVEMLTGQPVVNIADPLRCIAIHSQGALEIPAELRGGPLGSVLDRALAFDPMERFPEAGAMAEALAQVEPDQLRAPVLYAGASGSGHRLGMLPTDDSLGLLPSGELEAFGELPSPPADLLDDPIFASVVDKVPPSEPAAPTPEVPTPEVSMPDAPIQEPSGEVVPPAAVKVMTLAGRRSAPREATPQEEAPVPFAFAPPPPEAQARSASPRQPEARPRVHRGLWVALAASVLVAAVAVLATIIGVEPVPEPLPPRAVLPPEDFALVRVGTFKMGSPEQEEGRHLVDEVRHEVALTRPFIMQRTEVTQGQWDALIGNRPWAFKKCGDECPVERVSWWDALYFANLRSLREQLRPCYEMTGCEGDPGVNLSCQTVRFVGMACSGYRLPTEAEWEYAARGGTEGPTHSRLEEIAWFKDNAEGGPKVAGRKVSNAFGLFDMHGNVREWVWDVYAPYEPGRAVDPLGPEPMSPASERVHRGCSWYEEGQGCRAADRGYNEPTHRVYDLGFRLARTWD